VNIGDSFMYPIYGRGVIQDVIVLGGRVYADVQFGYARNSTPLDQIPGGADLVRFVRDQLPPATRKAMGPTPPAANSTSARGGVQALKLGQVREDQVAQLSVGTDHHEGAFTRALEAAARLKPKKIMIEGAWGVGKTHLLTLLSALAVQRKFAVSSCILDGVSMTLKDPMGLIAGISSSIRLPDEAVPVGFGSKLAGIKRSGMPELRGLAEQRTVQLVESIPSEALDDPEVIATIEDYMSLALPASTAKRQLADLGYPRVQLPPLRARSVEDRAQRFCDLLGDWAALSVAAGARGLLVVLDEVDVDYAWAMYLSSSARARHDDTLGALGAIGRRGVPLVIAFGSASAGPDTEDEFDAVHDVIRQVGGVDEHAQAVKLGTDHLVDLGGRVLRLYDQAYPGFAERLGPRGLKDLNSMLLAAYRRQLSPAPRRYVRSLLHCFDLVDMGQRSVAEIIQANQ